MGDLLGVSNQNPDGGVAQVRQGPASKKIQAAGVAAANLVPMMEEVTESGLMENIRQLEAFPTRLAMSESAQKASTHLFTVLRKLGYNVKYQYFLGPEGKILRNVIAVKAGHGKGNKKIVVSAHYDSINMRGPKSPAPGADDNGSGLSAVLEIARVVSRRNLKQTVEFAFFSAEEFGLLGSDYYAWNAHQQNEDITAFINLDQIGLSQNPKAFGVFSVPGSNSIVEKFKALLKTYLPDSAPVYVQSRGQRGSDHLSFWENGFQGIALGESENMMNPFVHSEKDTAEKLNPKLISRITKAALMLLLDLAEIVPGKPARVAPSLSTENPAPELQVFKQILKQRIMAGTNLSKIMQLASVIYGLNDREMIAALDKKLVPILKANIAGNDLVPKVRSLYMIAKMNKADFVPFILSEYQRQDRQYKPYFLMALAHLGGSEIDRFLLDLYRNGSDVKLAIEAGRSYVIRQKSAALETLTELRAKENRPEAQKALDEMLVQLKTHRRILQTW